MKLNLENKKKWQVGSGDGTRSYAQVFFDFGVALVGPGDPGKEGDTKTKTYYKNNPGVNNWGAKLGQLQPGEWIILRKGRKEVLGVGEVIEPYNYSHIFQDVDGWDLQHYVEVQWYRPKERILFSGTPLAMSTLASCNHLGVLQKVANTEFEEVNPRTSVKEKTNANLEPISLEKLTDSLIEHGLRIQDAEGITQTIGRIIRLTKWYYQYDYNVSEHELRTFLVVPLLVALGWSEQKIKIELRNIDIALFNSPYISTKANHISPQVIIETKVFNDGLAFTDSQVMSYGERFPSCEYFITTNGYRYKFYQREDQKLKQKGYINLFKMRSGDPLDEGIKGAIETLLMMSAFRFGQTSVV